MKPSLTNANKVFGCIAAISISVAIISVSAVIVKDNFKKFFGTHRKENKQPKVIVMELNSEDIKEHTPEPMGAKLGDAVVIKAEKKEPRDSKGRFTKKK